MEEEEVVPSLTPRPRPGREWPWAVGDVVQRGVDQNSRFFISEKKSRRARSSSVVSLWSVLS